MAIFSRIKLLTLALLLSSMSIVTSSCVYQDEVECPCEVKLVFDRNMEFADAFTPQVGDVALMIFDQDGKFIKTIHEEGDALHADNTISPNLAPGSYKLLAWGGLGSDKNGYYHLNSQLTPGVSTIADAKLSLERAESGIFDHPLTNLFHGMSDFVVEGNSPSRTTIYMTQNVNRLKVMLQRIDDADATAADYNVSLSAANYSLAHDNSLLPVPAMEYRPYAIKEHTINNNIDSKAESQDVQVVTAELATLRLVPACDTRFAVSTDEGEKLLDIDLIKYLDIMRLEEHSSMPLEEYLDRENTWQIVLFMGKDDKGKLVMISMKINQWTYVFNDVDLN